MAHSPAAANTRPIYLTREGQVFRLAFPYRQDLVERMRELPYASFDRQTKSWTCQVSKGSVEQLRRMYFPDGLTDVSVDDLLEDGEQLPEVRQAMVRAGSTKRPFVVHMATRDDHLYSRLRAIPGAQWDKSAQAITYPPQAAAALAELAERGVLDDQQKLLRPADVVVTFDGRTGRFKVIGDKRAQPVFDRHFPARDVVEIWKSKGIDVDFSDDFTREIYAGERARVGDGIQPASMTMPLFPYQAVDVAYLLERTGAGVYHAPGVGKCVEGSQRVWVDGRGVPIEQLWERHASPSRTDDPTGGEWATPTAPVRVHTLGPDGRMRTVEASRLFRQHVREDLRTISLQDGSHVVTTQAHQFLTERGWTHHVQPGDRVAVPRRVGVTGQARDLELVELLAWQIGEGWEGYPDAVTQQITITQKDAGVLRHLAELTGRVTDRHGLRLSTTTFTAGRAGRSSEVDLWVQGWAAFSREVLGYEFGHRSAGKRVPDYVATGDDDAARTFLRHYFAGEGHVNRNLARVELVTASAGMADDLRYLLRRFGVWARMQHKRKSATNGANIVRDYYELLISGRSLAAFVDNVGIADDAKQAALDALRARDCTSNDNLDTRESATLRELVELADLAPSALGVHCSATLPDRRPTAATLTQAADACDQILDGSLLAATEARVAAGGTGSHNQWTRRTIASLRNIDVDTVTRLQQRLRLEADAEVVWVTVTSVETAPHDGYVYDLEVAESHNLVVEGVVSHNTAIALGAGCELLDRGEVTRVVMVVPSAIRTQLAREIVRFTRWDEDEVVVIGGSKKKRHEAYFRAEKAKWLVVHYDVLTRDYDLLKGLCAGSLMVFDESHKIKSPAAKRTKAAKRLAKTAARRITMTGTPVENDPGEWYSILGQIAVPGCLGTPHEFFNRYQYPGRFGGYEGARNLPELRVRSAVHYTRRLKSEIAQHLPPLRVQQITLDPDPAYAAALKRAHREARDEIAKGRVEKAKQGGGLLWGEDVDAAEAGAEMTAVGMLRAMCSSPRLLAMSDSEAATALADAGLVVEADGPKLDELRTLTAELRFAREQRLAAMAADGRTAHQANEVSSERVVVFTYSRKMADLISQRLSEDGVPHRTYHGGTSQADRDAAVEAFTDPDTDITALVCTDAAAEGLNLGRCCNLLINFDVPWNPSTLIQRGNRIHRVDGTAPHYLVVNYTVAGTIEGGILKMLERKVDLSDAILGESGGRAATTGRRQGNDVKALLAEAFEAAAATEERDADGRMAA